jgi:hypothetical protein
MLAPAAWCARGQWIGIACLLPCEKVRLLGGERGLVLDTVRELVEEEVRCGCLMPEDVFCLHFQAQVDGKPVRTIAELLEDVDAGAAPAVEDMRLQLCRHAVDDADFAAAVRRLLVGRAS